MDDRKLLEMAAKAAGIEIDWLYTNEPHRPSSLPDGWFVVRNASGGQSFWNPLTDDGDALRLAVKLGIVINCRHITDPKFNEVWYWTAQDVKEGRAFREVRVDSEDSMPAICRAIVRAAAEIGKAMT